MQKKNLGLHTVAKFNLDRSTVLQLRDTNPKIGRILKLTFCGGTTLRQSANAQHKLSAIQWH